ncbi:dTMP kinase [Phormidium tenue FACHB-886]|nr:dTMP kinase [Phormidium tenue FACHB-886]
MQGKLIVFEGVEGCGKTTQLKRSQAWLQDSDRFAGSLHQLQTTREPGGTEFCQAIRKLLLQPASPEPIAASTELLLYAADRAQHVAHFLQPHLQQGAVILCDRYTDSTIAYQGYGRGLDRSLIEQLNQIATQGLTSDLTLWLDVDVETGLTRAKQRSGGGDRMEQATLEFHYRVQQGFRELAANNPDRIVRIDASLDEMAVFEQIQSVLQQYLSQWF